MLYFVILFAGFFLNTKAALFLTPPTNVWARHGEKNVTLVCKASEKIRSCSWETPYGKTYPLEAGLTAEGGRLQHYAVDPALECGVLIEEIQKNDEGRWRCNVAVVENKEVSSAQGMANISIAIPPEGVTFNTPFSSGSVNISAGSMNDVTCTATNTRPSPVFVWTIGGMPVVGKTMDEEQFVDTAGLSTFSQTLKYKALPEHANKTLSCSISHPGLQSNVTLNVTVIVTGSDTPSGEFSGLPTGGIVGIALAVVIITLVTVLALLYRGKCGKGAAEKSGETVKITTAGEENDEEVPANKTTESLEISSNKPETYQHFKFTAILQKFRKAEKNLDETAASEFEKVELNDEAEKKDKEKVVEEGENKDEKVKLLPKVRSLINKLKMKPAKKDDVEMGETKEKKDVATTDEVDVEENMEELEPEDKDEKEEGAKEEKKIGSETPV